MPEVFGIDPSIDYSDEKNKDPEKALRKSVMFGFVYKGEEPIVKRYWKSEPDKVISIYKELLNRITKPWSAITMLGTLAAWGVFTVKKEEYLNFIEDYFYKAAKDKIKQLQGSDKLYLIAYLLAFLISMYNHMNKVINSYEDVIRELKNDSNWPTNENSKKLRERVSKLLNVIQIEYDLLLAGEEIPPEVVKDKRVIKIKDYIKPIIAALKTQADVVIAPLKETVKNLFS